MTVYRDAPAPSRACPRCALALDERAVGDASVDECASCRGVFVARELLPRLLDSFDLGLEAAMVFPRGEPTAVQPGPLYVACPICRRLMNRRLFATGAKVIVDSCYDHGVWFDAAELRAIVDFAAGGGMERAAEADERRRRYEERARLARPHIEEPEERRAAKLVQFITALFQSAQR